MDDLDLQYCSILQRSLGLGTRVMQDAVGRIGCGVSHRKSAAGLSGFDVQLFLAVFKEGFDRV